MQRASSVLNDFVTNTSPKHRSPHKTQHSDLLTDVLAGLSETPKQLQPKYFYDEAGSRYFDQICALEEYYPYRAELSLLPQVAQELKTVLHGNYSMIEFGAGSLRKVQPLLDSITGIQSFAPIDISGQHLHEACQQLQADYPRLQVRPVVGDFCQMVELPDMDHERLGFFPGSTIGNFSPASAREFLRNAGKTLGEGSYLLIGVDTKKSPQLLHSAYNDRQGVTARFNRNILTRINRELNADFDEHCFEHYAFYNPGAGRVEMHLLSTAEQVVHIGEVPVRFRAGESIHTENSYKYTPADFRQLARSAGWKMDRQWMAEDNLFATYLLRYGPEY